MQWSYLDSVLIAVISFHLIQAPYTKVEESFSIQAIHDILKYGVFDLDNYDHFKFPGAVQRSFVAPLVIALLTSPFKWASSWFNANSESSPTDFETQLLARCIIGLLNGLGFIYLKYAAQTYFEKEQEEKKNQRNYTGGSNLTTVSTWYLVFIISSFHLMFYSSRALPNFILALPLTNVVLGKILLDDHYLAIMLCAIVSVILRSEVGLLGVGLTIFSISFKKISIVQAFKAGLLGFLAGITVTLYVDSYFWREWCVPEVDAFIFNVVSGNASQWGTEPIHAYLTHYLRMIYLPPTILFLCLLGFNLCSENMKIVVCAALFHIFGLSLQPHKEWRFIVYSLPAITLSGSVAAAYIWENIRATSVPRILLVSMVPVSAIISFVCSMVFLYISKLNYPGGDAMFMFNDMAIRENITDKIIHLSIPACMTGVTLFGELNQHVYNVTYDKTEDPNILQDKWPSFDYLITTETDASLLPFENSPSDNWEKVGSSTIFAGINSQYLQEIMTDLDTSLYKVLKEMVLSRKAQSKALAFVNKLIRNEEFLFIYKRIKQDELQNITEKIVAHSD